MKRRIIYFIAFLILVSIEVYIALFVHDSFVRPYVGDVLVVAVLYFFARTFFPDGCRFLPVFIFVFATGVEFLQALNIAKRLGLADHTFIRILLGSVFDGMDIVCYGIGCAVLQIVELLKNGRRLKE